MVPNMIDNYENVFVYNAIHIVINNYSIGIIELIHYLASTNLN